MGTILGKGFPQALVHTVHSTPAFGKPFPKIVPMAKLDRQIIFIESLVFTVKCFAEMMNKNYLLNIINM
jgi:hypothetical protein